MDELEKLQKERDFYDKKMGEVLNGKIHLTKNWVKVEPEQQKKKDLFLYKFYEFHFNRLDKAINDYILS